LPKGKRAIGSKWVFRNKKDERGIVTKNKARLVAHEHTQEEGINYNEVFAPVARIEAIWLFLAYASFMDFMVNQMDVKSAFLYGTIKEEVYICQPLGFKNPDYHDKVYVDDIIFRSTNKELCKAFEKLLKDKFQMSFMGELTFFLGLQVKKIDDRIFISQDKYIAGILRNFGFADVKSASTPIKSENPLLKDPDVVYSDSDYAGASLDRKSTTGGCQFLGVNTPRCDENSIELKELIVFMCLSAKRTAWNEFSCYMASAVICLATCRKFNFSKYIFDNMVRNVDSTSKFLMYPYFLQVVIHNQVDDLTSDNTRYTPRALTQKVFANMQRVGKETHEEVVTMDAEPQGRITQEEVNAISKGVSAAEPTIFDDEEIAQKLHDEEVQKAAARDKQEKDDMERAQVLQKQYDDKEENIDSNAVAEQPDKDVEEPKKKRVAVETLLQESFKKLKAVEVSVSEFKVEALQVKYRIIDWEIHIEGSRTYWKIIRVAGITEAYQSFKNLLKGFDREDLVALWNLVKEKFSSAVPSVDKEKALWVELKRLFKPNSDNVL
nr:hypothetical protein [Tanacetum cinerariifolium]